MLHNNTERKQMSNEPKKESVGFIRMRKRQTKTWGDAANYDIVRAVRINGKPTHQFVLGLGSVHEGNQNSGNVTFWMDAIERMTKHGLSPSERAYFVAACERKGARLPTRQQCMAHRDSMKQINWWKPEEARKLRAVCSLL
jgi:phage-related protein